MPDQPVDAAGTHTPDEVRVAEGLTPATFDPSPVHELLDKAAELYHRLRGDRAPDRAEQLDASIATARMVVDHTAHTINESD